MNDDTQTNPGTLMDDYEPRYLAGILFFNEQDYFEAHEVWEDLWAESYGEDHRFVQGLIQAAVGLFHFHGGNLRGARKLFRTALAYMQDCASPHWGLDIDTFWLQMRHCFEPILDDADPENSIRPDPDRLPRITLDPSPTSWPDPELFLDDEDD